MRRIRFTIASVLASVVFIAFAIAALREATILWDSGAFTLALSLFVASILLAVHRSGERRAYWLGFALCGAAYLAASLMPPVECRLLTTKGLAYLDAKVIREPGSSKALLRWPGSDIVLYVDPAQAAQNPKAPGAPDFAYSWMFAGTTLTTVGGATENFMRIGHSILAVMIGFAGGHVSRRLYVAGHRPVS